MYFDHPGQWSHVYDDEHFDKLSKCHLQSQGRIMDLLAICQSFSSLLPQMAKFNQGTILLPLLAFPWLNTVLVPH